MEPTDYQCEICGEALDYCTCLRCAECETLYEESEEVCPRCGCAEVAGS